MARRKKIDRGVGTPSDLSIVRLDVYREDDDGKRFRSSMSLDPSTLELALAVHGSTRAATDWLRTRAEELWGEDRLLRLEAKALGHAYQSDSSISRDVAREVVGAATARLLQIHALPGPGQATGPGAQAAPGPQPRRRRPPPKARTTEGGERMAGRLVELVLHEDGRLSGRALAGLHEGRDLRDLSLTDLLGLFAEAGELDDRTDESLVQAYLDHRHPDWRTSVSEGSDELREDRELLGLPPGADATQLKLAHRRLMTRVHPDTGGTAALAARLNLARDRILAAITAAKNTTTDTETGS